MTGTVVRGLFEVTDEFIVREKFWVWHRPGGAHRIDSCFYFSEKLEPEAHHPLFAANLRAVRELASSQDVRLHQQYLTISWMPYGVPGGMSPRPVQAVQDELERTVGRTLRTIFDWRHVRRARFYQLGDVLEKAEELNAAWTLGSY